MRTIKPGFFTNEDLSEVTPLGRLLFIGLWTLADREGRLEDRPRKLKYTLLPLDECDVDALLADLAARGFIVRYEANGKRYIQVVNFIKHQQPHYKEVASEIPPPPGHQDSLVQTFGVPDEQRGRILARDGRRCVKCGATEGLSIDHIIPRSKGGSGEDDNLQTLCTHCNSSKNNRTNDKSSSDNKMQAGGDDGANSEQARDEVDSTLNQGRPDVAPYNFNSNSNSTPLPPTRVGGGVDVNPGETPVGEALAEIFPGYANDWRRLDPLAQVAISLHARGPDVLAFPAWLKGAYPRTGLTPWSFRNHFPEFVRSRKVVALQARRPLCGSCRDGYVKGVCPDGVERWMECRCRRAAS